MTTFEDHISYVEEALTNLENEDLTLEEAVESYNVALTRIKLARKILENTQNEIEIIEGKREGKMLQKNARVKP